MVNSRFGGFGKSRRGVSSIVGGVIFLVLLSAGFSSFLVAMDVQRDTVETQRTISNSMMEKTQERFEIAVSSDKDNSNQLGIQVKNQGSNPVEVAKVWIINKTTHDAKQWEVDYSDTYIPPGFGSNVLENTPLFLTNDNYQIKVVSALGTIEQSDLIVGGTNNLRAELLAIPPDVVIGQNVTVTMHVENIGNSKLLYVKSFDTTFY